MSLSSPLGCESFKVGVKTRLSPEAWVFNSLRFRFAEEGISYGVHLEKRWVDVLSTTVERTTDEPNCEYPVPSDRYDVARDSKTA
jgi:hypothetical protein